MSRGFLALPLGLLVLLVTPQDVFGRTRFPGKDVGRLYDRIASDLAAGRPLVSTIYVALCDNDTQGIVKVRNPRLCRGDAPGENLYWAARGGLATTLRKAGWRQIAASPGDGALAIRAVWRKTMIPDGALRARGVGAPFAALIVGLGYRGDRIRQAMLDYLAAVNRDEAMPEEAGGYAFSAGGASHVVGYIGHDYFYDVDDSSPLLALQRGSSTLQKGAFALACTGHTLIRPAIARPNVHIFVLNRTLGFPGAWTAEAAVAALAAGKNLKGIHRAAAAAFAAGKGIALGTALASFAYGD